MNDIKDAIKKIYELEARIKKLEENSHEPVDIPELIRSMIASYGLIEGNSSDE